MEYGDNAEWGGGGDEIWSFSVGLYKLPDDSGGNILSNKIVEGRNNAEKINYEQEGEFTVDGS